MRFLSSVVAILMLGAVFILMFFSAWGDSATMDELAHIPAGYSYLTLHDYRLNPEHPPLIKDLAAFPLLYLDLNFPTDVKAWQEDINGQWDMGKIFLYESGNSTDKILHFSRFPVMLLALLFGWLLFKWTRGLYGDKVGLLTLFFFAFSPTFLAHSRYVTTDLAAAFGFFIGIAAFMNFISRQNGIIATDGEISSTKKSSGWKSLVIAGIAFGIALLLKFSLFLLAPLYLVYGILWVILGNWPDWKKICRETPKMLGKICLIGLIAIVLITIVYQFHIWNYPAERQVSDTVFILGSFGIRPLVDITVWLADKPILRGFGQYMLGLLMVIQRAAGGNTTYFMGEISAAGWKYYFPLLYFLKEHLAFHIFTIIAVIYSIRNILKAKEKNIAAIIGWMKDNFALVGGIIFIAVYWLQSISSPLNIGVRHVLPTFPFIYLLVSRQIVRWSKVASIENPQTLKDWIKNAFSLCFKSLKKYLLITFLSLWLVASILATFPYYLSYYNGLAGGTSYGYKVATDSNYDWGQDLKRLDEWMKKNSIEKINLDYFGGGNPQYYLRDKLEPWWSAKGQPPEGSWFAISATFQQGALARPVKNFTQNPQDAYPWLKDKTPIARAGTSIFIYKF